MPFGTNNTNTDNHEELVVCGLRGNRTPVAGKPKPSKSRVLPLNYQAIMAARTITAGATRKLERVFSHPCIMLAGWFGTRVNESDSHGFENKRRAGYLALSFSSGSLWLNKELPFKKG